MIDLVKYMMIPYKENGRTFDGADCYGLVYLILKEKGFFPPDYAPVTNEEISDTIRLALHDTVWQKTDTIPGSVALLRIKGCPFHVGYMVDELAMIHMERTGCYLDEIDTAEWKNRVLGFYTCLQR